MSNFEDGPVAVIKRQIEFGEKELASAREYLDQSKRQMEGAAVEVTVLETKLEVWRIAKLALENIEVTDGEG